MIIHQKLNNQLFHNLFVQDIIIKYLNYKKMEKEYLLL